MIGTRFVTAMVAGLVASTTPAAPQQGQSCGGFTSPHEAGSANFWRHRHTRGGQWQWGVDLCAFDHATQLEGDCKSFSASGSLRNSFAYWRSESELVVAVQGQPKVSVRRWGGFQMRIVPLRATPRPDSGEIFDVHPEWCQHVTSPTSMCVSDGKDGYVCS